jgi:hypothetical protein
VYDLTEWYASKGLGGADHSSELFMTRVAHALRWQGKIPNLSFVGVQGIPYKFLHKNHNHVEIQFSLCRVFVFATLFSQKSGAVKKN